MTRYITPTQYGAQLLPPICPSRVRILCRQRRIAGARCNGIGNRAAWSIPANAPDPRKATGRPRK